MPADREMLVSAIHSETEHHELLADAAVMMRKLYDNITAPDSVAVMSLNGSLLGYVPRRHIHRFVHDTNFGHVYAINQGAAGLWRLTVSVNCLWPCFYCFTILYVSTVALEQQCLIAAIAVDDVMLAFGMNCSLRTRIMKASNKSHQKSIATAVQYSTHQCL